jgi:hypothetical protein
MKHLPSEIDALMWDVAEADEQELMDSFVERYPQHRDELVKRINMVRHLKGARPKKEKQKEFVPATVIRPAPHSRFWSSAAVVMLVVAAAFATYAGIRIYDQRNQAASPPEESLPLDRAEQNRALEQSTWIGEENSDDPNAMNGSSPNGTPPNVAPYIQPIERLVTIETQGMALSGVLESIAQQAGIRLQAAPGMPEIQIRASYRNLSALSVLRDLGRNFGFTPLVQTEREALLVPAVDPSAPSSSGLNDSYADVVDGETPPAEEGTLEAPPRDNGTVEITESDQTSGLSGPIGEDGTTS